MGIPRFTELASTKTTDCVASRQIVWQGIRFVLTYACVLWTVLVPTLVGRVAKKKSSMRFPISIRPVADGTFQAGVGMIFAVSLAIERLSVSRITANAQKNQKLARFFIFFPQVHPIRAPSGG